MALGSEALLNYPIPEVRQRYSRHDSVFYTLTLSLSDDPLDERQLVYVDPYRDPQALPCMALVLGHPGFWLGNPATGVDILRLVHDERRLEWRRSLPTEGGVIGQTRVTGLVDRGADRDTLLYSEEMFSNVLSDEALAVTHNTTFLRSDGGFGGSRRVPEMSHRLSERTPDPRPDLPICPEQALYYRLSGDDNPLHAKSAAAPWAGSPWSILRGLHILGVVPHAVLHGFANYRTEQLGHLQVCFSAPVFPGETLHIEMWNDGSFRIRAVERDVVVLDNGRVGPSPERPD